MGICDSACHSRIAGNSVNVIFIAAYVRVAREMRLSSSSGPQFSGWLKPEPGGERDREQQKLRISFEIAR